jgi:hypothetical protein
MTLFSSGRLSPLVDIGQYKGHCFTASTPNEAPQGDDVFSSGRSSLRLFEDGIELGPAHSIHEAIVADGNSRFSHWDRLLLFSSSDGSDPRTNGRSYQMLYLPENDARSGILTAALNVSIRELDFRRRYDWGERSFSVFVPEVKLGDCGRSVFLDTDFLADYELFDRSNYRSFDRKFPMKELLKLALPLSGDLAECGVFRGASAFLLTKGMTAGAPDKRLHLFDAFAGLSEPKIDIDGTYWRPGDLACSLSEVALNLRQHENLIVFHPGWIPEKFSEVSERTFCFVHIDVGLFEPTQEALSFFGPRMAPGSLIVCDDYGFRRCPGARRAMDEYAAASGQTIVHLPTGQGFIASGR